ncbi:MAG TPA: siphovirus Gp157 family protein [Tepidisphaeraceae bacterium]|nr:siphovirus Gp157 family protein [Tepidisphaeraceae bacterium]
MNPFDAAACIREALAGEELSEEQVVQLAASEQRIESYAEHVKDLEEAVEGRIEARKKRIKAYQDANVADENRVQRAKETLAKVLKLAGLAKLKTAFLSAYFKSSASVVVECDVEAIPEEFRRTKTTTAPDKEKLKQLWKAGGTLPSGVRVEESESLVVQ